MKAKNCFRLFRKKKKKVPKIRELLGNIREIVLFAVYVPPNPNWILFPQWMQKRNRHPVLKVVPPPKKNWIYYPIQTKFSRFLSLANEYFHSIWIGYFIKKKYIYIFGPIWEIFFQYDVNFLIRQKKKIWTYI